MTCADSAASSRWPRAHGRPSAIRGALATGIVRILVTDAPTARAVLDVA